MALGHKPNLHETVLAVIPCRQGSKRLLGKNTRLLGGRPLVDHTLLLALESSEISDILVTTDDPAVAERAKKLGCPVPFLRPVALSTDESSTAQTTLHALNWSKAHTGKDPDIVVLLQVTSPLRPPEAITQAVTMLRNHHEIDAVVSMRNLQLASDNLYSEGQTGFLTPLIGIREAASVLIPNGAIYAIRTPVFRRQLTFVPERTIPIVMGASESIDIDTLEDLKLAEALLPT